MARAGARTGLAEGKGGGCGAGSGGGLGVGGGAAQGEDARTLAVAATVWHAVSVARAGGRGKLGAMLTPSAAEGGRLLLLREGRRAFGLPEEYFGNAPAGVQVAWPADALRNDAAAGKGGHGGHGGHGGGGGLRAVAAAVGAARAAAGPQAVRAQAAWLHARAPADPRHALSGGQLDIDLFAADLLVSSWLGSGLHALRFGGGGGGGGGFGGDELGGASSSSASSSSASVVSAACGELDCAFTLGSGVPVVPNTCVLMPVPGASGAVDVSLHLPSAVAKQLLADVNGDGGKKK